MITVVQRVSRAQVTVQERVTGEIGRGLLLLVGVERGDGEADARATADKIAGLRLFAGRTPFDHSVEQIGAACLVVSQFTLAGSIKKGRRPGFDRAEHPDRARPVYEAVAGALSARGLTVATGEFGANMAVDLVNDGPVTLLVCARGGRIADL